MTIPHKSIVQDHRHLTFYIFFITKIYWVYIIIIILRNIYNVRCQCLTWRINFLLSFIMRIIMVISTWRQQYRFTKKLLRFLRTYIWHTGKSIKISVMVAPQFTKPVKYGKEENKLSFWMTYIAKQDWYKFVNSV